MGGPEAEAFLSHLASGLHLSASSQTQALNALVFLYDSVLHQPLGELAGLKRVHDSAGQGHRFFKWGIERPCREMRQGSHHAIARTAARPGCHTNTAFRAAVTVGARACRLAGAIGVDRRPLGQQIRTSRARNRTGSPATPRAGDSSPDVRAASCGYAAWVG